MFFVELTFLRADEWKITLDLENWSQFKTDWSQLRSGEFANPSFGTHALGGLNKLAKKKSNLNADLRTLSY